MKYSEGIKRIGKIYGDKTLEECKKALQNLIKAIDDYEQAGPIDIRNGEKDTPNFEQRKVKLGMMVNRLAEAEVFTDALMVERYYIAPIGIDNAVSKVLKDYE